MTVAGASSPAYLPPDTPAIGPLPRWFWLLPLLAIAAWWPLDPYWQSDDYLALHYANDFGNVLHDFVGPQYGATDTWWFYRPLITFSFWLDLQLGGAFSSWSFWSNVLAHATNALLVGLIWRRFLDDRRAFGAGLLWLLMPSHIGSIAWAVGRVDSHTTIWCLLTIWLCLRSDGTRRANGWIAATMAIALMEKELALIVPPLATLLVALHRHGGPWRARGSRALRTTASAWLVLACYLPFRMFALGRFGGYAAAQYEPQSMLRGLATTTGHLLVPLQWIGTPTGATTMWLAAAALPIAIAVVLAGWRQRPRFVVGTLAVFVVACAPMAAIFAAADDPQTLRNYYLPAVALAGLLAASGRLVTFAVVAAWLWPLLAARHEQHDVDLASAAMHRALLQEQTNGAPSPMFVAGLPHASPHRIAVQLHFGIDRMLQPPFGDGTAKLYALRPLWEDPTVFRLSPPGASPSAMLAGSTWYFADPTTLHRAPPPARLPELLVTGDDDGVFDFSTHHLEQLEQGRSFALTTPGNRPPFFRLTVFTASGYLSCVFEDHAEPGDADGRIDALMLLAAAEPKDEHGHVLHYWKARYALADAFFSEAMTVPTTIDLGTDFPLLLEGGTFDGAQFVPTHRASRPLRMRFDRAYPAWVRRVQGK